MLTIKWGALVCGALITVCAHAGQEVGDYSGLPKDLADAATAYDLAQFRSDRRELERLLADDYVLVGSDGRNQTKAEYLADATAPGSKTLSVAITRQIKRAWPNGAVLGGMVDAKGLSHGKQTTTRARFVDIWAKRDGRWQVIFTQADNVRDAVLPQASRLHRGYWPMLDGGSRSSNIGAICGHPPSTTIPSRLPSSDRHTWRSTSRVFVRTTGLSPGMLRRRG